MKLVYLYIALTVNTLYAEEPIILVAKPTLKSPLPFCITRSARLPIHGKTEPNYNVFFYIDNVQVGETKSNYDGFFNYRLIGEQELKRGIYALTVQVVDPQDPRRTATRTLTFAVSDCGYYDSLYAQHFIIKIMTDKWRGELE